MGKLKDTICYNTGTFYDSEVEYECETMSVFEQRWGVMLEFTVMEIHRRGDRWEASLDARVTMQPVDHEFFAGTVWVVWGDDLRAGWEIREANNMHEGYDWPLEELDKKFTALLRKASQELDGRANNLITEIAPDVIDNIIREGSKQ